MMYQGYELYTEKKLPKGTFANVSGHFTSAKGTYRYRSPTHQSWFNMIVRCYFPLKANYRAYGGAGVRVCVRWITGDGTKCGFLCYLEDMGERPEGCTAGRHGDEGHYVPGNVSWQTKVEQNKTRYSRKKKKAA